MAKPRSLNRVMIIGNLTRDPQLREGKNNVKICSFGVATNTSWKDSNGSIQERAEFHNVVAFNKLAEICYQVLSVGMLVYLEGELRTRIIDDEGDNSKHYYTNIKLIDMLVLDSKGKAGAGNKTPREEEVEVPAETDERRSVAGSEEEEFKSEELF